MAWTSPRTWVSGEVPSAATLNTHIRDNLKAIGDPWTSFTPTWTATGTAPALGNGVLTGRYAEAGKSIRFSFEWRAGSTTTFGTGSYRWALPKAAIAHTAPMALEGWVYGEDSGANGYLLFPRFVSTTTFELAYHAVSGAGVIANVAGQTTPFTWANADFVRGYVSYEAA